MLQLFYESRCIKNQARKLSKDFLGGFSMSEYFNTVEFIHKLERDEIFYHYKHVIEKICKKIDVVGKVNKFYESDLAKKKSIEEIDDTSYVMLLNILCSYAIFFHDIKFVNSSFKLLDLLHRKNIMRGSDFSKWQNKLSETLEIIHEMGRFKDE